MRAIRRQQARKASTTRPETGALHPRDESRGFRSQVSVIADAINQAGTTDPNKVLDVLRAKTFDAPYFVSGKIKFDDKGQNDFSASVMVQVLNGVYEAVWPVEFKTAEAVPAFPAWNKR
ncbi:MAG: hypothetical protein ACOYES_04380 [Bacillota bacterium]|jgi:branched-chain amino acid transport system substrate-binding protein